MIQILIKINKRFKTFLVCIFGDRFLNIDTKVQTSKYFTHKTHYEAFQGDEYLCCVLREDIAFSLSLM